MSDEKTEKPTPKRRKENRKEGKVARTQELGAWSALLLASVLMPRLIGHEIDALRALMVTSLRSIQDPSVEVAMQLMRQGGGEILMALVALGACVLVVSVAVTVAQGGFYLATKAIKPTFSKLDPIKGAKRVFGPHSLWEGAKMLLKCAVVAGLVYSAVKSMMPFLGGMVPIATMLDAVGLRAAGLLRNVAIAGLVMAGADYLMQRRRNGKQTRMTKDEVKREHKQQEGDPLIKSAIRARQLSMARQRMMADVPTADVVLVNPTHVAVALRYDPGKGAPTVVARGAGIIASRIRELAAENDVPLVRDIPLARALYASTEVGREIPAELFAAVAHVLAFVISRRNRGQRGGEHRSPRRESELNQLPVVGRRKRLISGPVAVGR